MGFAHGTAGIWYSLLRLHSMTGEQAFRQAAEDGLASERGLIQWPLTNASLDRGSDARVPAGLIGTWCNGIPGIGLGRLGALSILKNNDVEQQIEVALRCAESWPLNDADHMCCGNFGRIELLLVASEKLSQPRLRTVARKAAALIESRARRAHGYRLHGEAFNAPPFNPVFFHGAAGIGYGFLRAAHPETLPCVLLWE